MSDAGFANDINGDGPEGARVRGQEPAAQWKDNRNGKSNRH
jgi:hypothetical protein